MFIKWIVNILKAVNSNKNPAEIAAGAAFGLLLALIPSNNLTWFVLFIIVFFLRVNLGIALIFTFLFKLIVPVSDPLLQLIGYSVLTVPALKPFFTALYNIPLVPFTKFNNTIVMGGLLTGIILWVPVQILFIRLVRLYRDKWRESLVNSKIVKGFLKLPVISAISKIYGKASDIYSIGH